MTATFSRGAGCDASVVIPAHNEGAVIDECLRRVAASHGDLTLEVVVAANGCTDDTVARARTHPGVHVLDLPTPSKVGALNAADRVASAFPRIYLDADVRLEPGTLAEMVARLSVPDAAVAAPHVHYDTDRSSRAVAAYYRVYEELPAGREGIAGPGVYAMNAAGRARFDTFPEVTGDDLFVERQFLPHERHRVGVAHSTAPRTLASLLRIRTRVVRGNTELAARPADQPRADYGRTTSGTLRALARSVLDEPGRFPDALAFAGVSLAARARARTSPAKRWERDDSSREPSTATTGPPAARPIAYLASHYPKLSATFIQREIAAVRSQGLEVETFSIRPCPPGEARSVAMREELARTHVLLDGDARKWIVAHARLLARHPGSWFRTLGRALRSGYPSPRMRLWQVFYFGEAVVLHDRLRRRGIRHIHVHHANVSADVARLTVALGEDVDGADSTWRWTLTMHGTTEFNDTALHDLGAKYASASAIAVISDATGGFIRSRLPVEEWGKVEVVHMSVDAAKFSPPAEGRGHDGPLRLLAVGRLVEVKGFPVLLDALALLAARGVDVHLRLVGSGPLEEFLHAQVAARDLGESVTIVGPLSEDELPDEYRAADVYVLTSFQEGLPVVVMEAMSAGLPVVVSQVGSIGELVENGVSGIVLPPARADLVADAIADLATDPERRAAIGRAARDAVVAGFTPEVTGPSMARFLRTAGDDLARSTR